MTAALVEVTIESFIDGNERNAWIKTEYHNIYVRRGLRIVDPRRFAPHVDVYSLKRANTFELANAETHRRADRGKGYFKKLMTELIKAVQASGKFDAIFLENVLDPRLQQYYLSLGFQLHSVDEAGQSCYYLAL